MNKNQNGLFRAAAATLALTLAMFFLRITVIWRDVDAASGLFSGGKSLLCTVFNAAGALLLIGYLAASFLLQARRKKVIAAPSETEAEEEDEFDRYDKLFAEEDRNLRKPEENEKNVSSLARTAVTWEGTLSAFSYFLPGIGFLFFALSFPMKGTMDTLTFLFSLISALCGAYFLLAGIRNRASKNVPLAFFGLIPAVWATLRMVIEYRNVQKYVNRDLYTANLLFLIAAICFFIYQAQVTLGDDSYAMPLSWAASALLVVMFGLSARLPHLLGLMADKLGRMDLVDAAGLILDLALTLFAALKLRALLRRGV